MSGAHHGELEVLSYTVVGFEVSGTNGDTVRVVQEVAGNRLHLLGPGGTPQQSLPVGTDLQGVQH